MSPGVLFMRVSEYAQPVELDLADEIDQLPVLFAGFARVSHNQRASQPDARDTVSELSNEGANIILRYAAAHAFKDSVRGMLNRHVHVLDDLGRIGNSVGKLDGRRRRMGVHEAINLEPVDDLNGEEQLAQITP